MSTQIERANQLYSEARFAEQQGNINRAEVLYVESKEIFVQEGGLYFVDAADILNTIASMKEMHGDYDEALRAIEKSTQILDQHLGTPANRKANEVRLRAWCITSNVHFHLERYDIAERVLQHALEYALDVFGETDEQTTFVRDQLMAMHQFMTESEGAKKL